MESAKTVKDTLSVYNEIADVNEEIEISKGQIKYMEQSARLSSISVQILSIPDPIVIAGNEWNPNDTVRGAVNDFINTGQDFIDALIYFVIAARSEEHTSELQSQY